MRNLMFVFAVSLLGIRAAEAVAVGPDAASDRYWQLLHEPAAIAELKLDSSQLESLQKLMDGLDLEYFPLRNTSPEVALSGASKLTTEARAELEKLLQPPQQQRLNELLLQSLGNQALLLDEVVSRLGYSESQKQRVKEIDEATQAAVAAIQKEASDGKPRQALEQKYNKLKTDQQKKIIAVLNTRQVAVLKTLFGPPFDVSKLGHPRFKAPELVDTGEWVNSAPLRLDQLRGKVVVVHFYAFGCINCIHNYPWYRQWRERFDEQDVAIIGIHTPETDDERESENVRRKVAEEKFEFPVLIDGKNENWNAWGNSMWPSVYVVDKRGYLRAFWPGELKWQGNDGEKSLREQIEALIIEQDP